MEKDSNIVNKKVKILVLIDQLHLSGGIERVLSYKVNHWLVQRKDIDLVILTNENQGKKFYYNFPSVWTHHELDVNYKRDLKLLTYINLKKSISHFFKLRKYLKLHRPDVVIHCAFGFDFYFLPFLKGGAKLIKEQHSSRFEGSRKTLLASFKGLVRKKFESFYDVMVFLSQEEKEIVKRNNVRVIANPICLDAKETNKERQNIILAAGRIVPVKGYIRLIEAWSKIHIKAPGWKVCIYGDGDPEYIRSIKEYIHKVGVERTVELLPSTPDIENKMQESKIYAMASLTECFPMVLLEAMVNGLPIISFDCPTGPRNILTNNKNGILVENDDIKNYSIKLLELIQNRELREKLSLEAKNDVIKYGIDNIMHQWDMLFEELLK